MNRKLLVIAETTYSDEDGPGDEIKQIADTLVGVGRIHTLHVAINTTVDEVLDVINRDGHD